jgi:hypothetical protein
MGNALRLLPSKALCITIVAAGRNVLAPYPGIECVMGPRNFAVFHNFHPIEITLAALPPALRLLFTGFVFAKTNRCTRAKKRPVMENQRANSIKSK